MNLWIRCLIVLFGSFFRPKIHDILSPSILTLRVLPNDLDTNLHMNNGRYLTIMDLGRFDLVLRSGLMRLMMQQKSVPILGSAKIRYRLPLNPFQSFRLETRLICWDDKWCYLEQRFIIHGGDKHNAVAAIALVKGSFYSNRSRSMVPTQQLLHAVGYDMPSPPFPTHILKWAEAEDSLRALTK